MSGSLLIEYIKSVMERETGGQPWRWEPFWIRHNTETVGGTWYEENQQNSRLFFLNLPEACYWASNKNQHDGEFIRFQSKESYMEFNYFLPDFAHRNDDWRITELTGDFHFRQHVKIDSILSPGSQYVLIPMIRAYAL